MAFAAGKFALALCDRCGFEYPYKTIRKEWNGAHVCQSCYEPKHPQLQPKRIIGDAQGLRFARPARTEPQLVLVGLGDSPFVNVGTAQAVYNLQPNPRNRPVKGVTRLGAVVATGDANVSVTGFGITASLGNESLPGVTTPVPVELDALVGSVGDVSVSTDQILSVSGLSATAALGVDITVFPLFWSEEAYGENAWDGYE